jgi:hypothetical protein
MSADLAGPVQLAEEVLVYEEAAVVAEPLAGAEAEVDAEVQAVVAVAVAEGTGADDMEHATMDQ